MMGRFDDSRKGQIALVFACVWLFVLIVGAGTWLSNAWQLVQCDFKAPYKCEIVHGVGLIPPVHFITAWIGGEE